MVCQFYANRFKDWQQSRNVIKYYIFKYTNLKLVYIYFTLSCTLS